MIISKVFKNAVLVSASTLVIMGAFSVQVHASGVSHGIYEIKSKIDNDYIFDVAGPSIDDGATLQLWENCDVENQKFEVRSDGNGFYVIKSVYSGMVLDTDGYDIYQYKETGKDSQKWKIEPSGAKGYYYLINKATNLYADVDNAVADCGINVKMFVRNDGYGAQEFSFELIEALEAIESSETPKGQEYRNTEEEKKKNTVDLNKVLKEIPLGTRWDDNTYYEDTAACFGFARKAFKILYGCDMAKAYTGKKPYNYGKPTNLKLINRLAEVTDDVSIKEIKECLMKSQAGDILQVGRYKSEKSTSPSPHTMVVESVTDDGVTVIHGNYDNKVCRTTFSWNSFKKNWLNNPKNYSGVGVSVYRYSGK